MSNNHNGRKGGSARQQHELHKRRLAAAIRRAERKVERGSGTAWDQADLSYARAQFGGVA